MTDASDKSWVRPALIRASLFTAAFLGINVVLDTGSMGFLLVFSAAMFLVFFGISAKAARRRRDR